MPSSTSPRPAPRAQDIYGIDMTVFFKYCLSSIISAWDCVTWKNQRLQSFPSDDSFSITDASRTSDQPYRPIPLPNCGLRQLRWKEKNTVPSRLHLLWWTWAGTWRIVMRVFHRLVDLLTDSTYVGGKVVSAICWKVLWLITCFEFRPFNWLHLTWR